MNLFPLLSSLCPHFSHIISLFFLNFPIIPFFEVQNEKLHLNKQGNPFINQGRKSTLINGDGGNIQFFGTFTPGSLYNLLVREGFKKKMEFSIFASDPPPSQRWKSV